MKLGWILWLASILGGNVQEQTCLATTVYLEARDQPVEGQYAVAEVALRRRESGRWGNNVCGVVKSSGQFAPTLLSKNYAVDNAKAWQKAWKVAGNSLQMWRLPAAYRKEYVPGADHFFAHEIARPAWLAYAEPIKVIGGHSFYRVDGVFRPTAMESLPGKVDGQATPAAEVGSDAGTKPGVALTVRGAG